MKYLVMEIQIFQNGAVSTPAYAYDDRSAAERQFHLLVAGAVVSSLPTHSVLFMTEQGQVLERKAYHHVQPEPEPTPEENPEENPEETETQEQPTE